MKRKLTLSLIAMVLFVAGCQQIDIQEDLLPMAKQDVTEVKKSPYDVSLKTATYLASLLSSELVTNIDPIVNGKDTVMFIVNYKDGWVVLSGDKRAVPILGNSTKGSFKSEIDNPGSAIWFNEAANEILNLKQTNPTIDEKSLSENKDYDFWMKMERASYSQNYTKSIAPQYYGDPQGTPYLCKRLISSSLVSERDVRVGPLLTAKWGQNDPWNTNLPFVLRNNAWEKAYVGCAAVAVGQTLHFTHFKFNVPSGLYHTVSSTGYIYDDTNYNVSFTRGDYVVNSPRWEQMALHSWQSNTNYVADFLADVGNRLNMKYGADGSGAYITPEALQPYGVTYDKKDYNYSDVFRNIRGGMPVMMTAYAKEWTTGWWIFKKTHYGDGHAWVIDGIVDKTRTMSYDYVWELVYVPNNPNPNNPYDPSYPQYPTPDFPIYDVSDLYMQYEEVLPLDVATNQGLYNGKTETTTSANTSSSFVMNWGWNNSSFDYQQYSPYTTIWSAGGYDFRYIREIYHNIRKIN